MHRRVVVRIVVLVALVASVGLPVGAADSAVPVTTPQGFDNSAFEITVYENGSARWTLQHARPLRNETEVRNFEEYATRFNAQETDLVRSFRNNSQSLVRSVSSSLDRPMAASNFEHRARIERLGGTRGVVELSFTWSNFARSADRTLVVADVFDGGMYIQDDQRLVFKRGPNLSLVEARPAPDSMPIDGNVTAGDTVTWLGERQFNDNRPFVRFAPPDVAREIAASDGTPGGNGNSDVTPPAGADGGGGMSLPLIAFAVLLVIGIGGGVVWYAGTNTRGSDDGETAAARAADSPSNVPEPAVPDEEIVSDEDRVKDLLEENGGRMKQVNIVDQTDWSKSKVSMLLSDMEDEGDISKLRVGRENIVSLAGQEPEAARSPFEDE